MNYKWIWFIAARYIFRRQKKSPASLLSVLGIATGVFALIVIIAVMNGFQLGFIESILEVSSYHIRAASLPAEHAASFTDAVFRVPGVEAVVPFQEFQGLVRGKQGGQQAAIVRGLPADALALDTAMAGRLEFEDGFFDLAGEHNVLIGAELARRLGVKTGDEINLFSIPTLFSAPAENLDADNAGGADTGSRVFTVAGVFRTGFYEFDSAWIFMGISGASAFSDTSPVLGIKLKNRFDDYKTRELIAQSIMGRPEFADVEFSTWRDYNRSFFGALRTEKLFMFILVGLIFIVVGLNIYQSQRRAVLEYREEVGLLRAIGGGEWAVRLIFVCDGAIIGFSGAAAGLVLGLLIASNIPLFFTAMESVANFFITIVNGIANLAGAGGGVEDFAFFSPAVFYIKEIPSRIIPQEAVLIFMFGFCSALAAAWVASRKVSRIRPAEVLRYE